jgi:ABC-2 type transport system permease protein
MAISAVISLVTIISIYREGGILKRLRATPLRPHTILSAHVLVKLLFTALTLTLMMLAGRRFYPVACRRRRSASRSRCW